MRRALSISGVVLLCAGVVFASDQNKRVKEPPPAKAPAAKALPVPRNRTGGTPKPAGGIANPGNLIQQLFRMSPEDRERALEKAPPQQQARIRQQLEKLDKLPAAQKAQMMRFSNELAALPPDTQLLVFRQINNFNTYLKTLPPDQQLPVKRELQRLRTMPEDRRNARIMSEEFRSAYSPDVQQMMIDIAQYLPIQR
jgi:hypothetical protein